MRPGSIDNIAAGLAAELDAALDLAGILDAPSFALSNFDTSLDSHTISTDSGNISATDIKTRGGSDSTDTDATVGLVDNLRETRPTESTVLVGGATHRIPESAAEEREEHGTTHINVTASEAQEEAIAPELRIPDEQPDEHGEQDRPRTFTPLCNLVDQRQPSKSIYLSPDIESWDDSKTPSPGHSRNTSTGSVETISRAPSKHPVSCMQGAFQESIVDSMDGPSTGKLAEKLSAETRRRQLLELESPYDGYSSRWQQKPDAKFHPLWKLVAQISYGVHLLHKGIARSDHQVVVTLQEHVDEIDTFVDDTLADFDLATKDIDDRLQALLLPLEHSRMFNRMLCDSGFRQSIVEGNDIIERIIARTTAAMHSALQDVYEGQNATRELDKFLQRLGSDWAKHNNELLDIFTAMRNNAQGWLHCFSDMQVKADHLAKLMNRLTYVVDDVAKRCGIASRRKTPTGAASRSSKSVKSRASSNSNTSALQSPNKLDKPLPAPPVRHRTTLSSPLLSSKSTQPPLQTPERPSLISTASSQTIDCTRSIPTSMEPRWDRPLTDAAPHGSTTAGTLPSEITHAASRNPRAVSQQTGLEQLDRRYPPSQMPPPRPGMLSTPRSTSALSNSSSQQSPKPTPAQTAQSLPPLSPRSLKPSGTSNHTVTGNILSGSPQLAGLGISHPMSQTQRTAAENTYAVRSNAVPEKSSILPAVSQTPSSTTPKSAPATSSRIVPSLASLSPFPPTHAVPAPALRTPSIDSRASDKIVVDNTPANIESAPSSAVDSAYQSSLTGSPPLSKSNSQTHLAANTTNLHVPFTPDDFTPYGALSSHPITASMCFQNPPGDTLTALPPVPPDMQYSNLDSNLQRGDSSRRPSFVGKKPSMPSMKSIFARKVVRKEQYLGSNGLGGFVAVQ